MMTQQEYVANQGSKCPNCGGRNVAPYDEMLDAGTMFIETECQDCEARWTEMLDVTGFENLSLKGDTE